MADTTGVLARLQAALSVYDPTWDVSVGTATYKILEAVAQEIANANNNSILQTYSYDITTKTGSELDAFANLFGIYRQLGKRASGMVTFSTSVAATTSISIPIGTQVAVPISSTYPTSIIFATTAPAVIGIGDSSVDVPVVAVIGGATGNVPTGAITSVVTTLFGVTGVINYSPTSGGINTESDSALQGRWTATVFSNNTGTQGKYEITALQDPNVSLVNSIGQQSFYDEQLQVQSTITVTASGTTAPLQFIAASGTTVNGITYSVNTVVSGVTITGSGSPSALQTALNAAINGIFPSMVVASGSPFTVSGINSATNLTTSGNAFSITSAYALPYRLVLTGTTNASGVTTNGAFQFYDFIASKNPDVGYSGTLSYNNGINSGYIYPQGNELVGQNLNTAIQTTYANLTDYYYPTNPTPQLKINITNTSYQPGLFIGNVIELISEYNSSANSSVALTSGNYVDIFINGTSASSTSEQLVFNPTAFAISSGNVTPYLNTAYYTLASGAVASSNSLTSGDYYLPINQQPAINFPSQLSVASGNPDTIYLYNTVTNSGVTYPICLYPTSTAVTFTGVPTSAQVGTNFLPVPSGTLNSYGLVVPNGTLIPGMIFSTASGASSNQNYITNVVSSGIYLNNNITITGSVVLSGAAIAYPLYDYTNTQGSVNSMNGLAFSAGINITGWPALPTTGVSWATYTHAYNQDVTTVEALIQQTRPFGSNTLVHQAEFINLIVNVRIIFTNGNSVSTTESDIFNQLNSYLSTFPYLSTISFSNIAAQILSVAGVANVRINSISTAAADGTLLNTYGSDFLLASNQLPNLYQIIYTVTGASNF